MSYNTIILHYIPIHQWYVILATIIAKCPVMTRTVLKLISSCPSCVPVDRKSVLMSRNSIDFELRFQ